MSMFPGYGASVYRNEDGEVIGWDYPSYDEPYYYENDSYDYEPDVCGDVEGCREGGWHGESCHLDRDEGWLCSTCMEKCDHDHS